MGDWNDKNTARLKELATGLKYFSNSDTALALNTEFGTTISRNAVIGKKGRLGIGGRKPPRKAKPRQPKPYTAPYTAPPVKPDYRLRNATRLKAIANGSDPGLPTDPALAEALIDAPLSQRRTLLQLNGQTCRWPVGEPGTPGFYFCGAVPVEGLPYCAGHCRRAFNPRAVVVPKAPWIPWDREKRT